MPRKVFVAGEILTAADVNTNLMDQAVMVFDDATARTTAIPTPVEGMVTYLKDLDAVEFFDGSVFRTVGGLIAVKSVLKTDTFTASVNAGQNVAVTDLSITHEVADSANRIIISAFFGVAGTTQQRAQVGIAVHDGTELIGVGDGLESRTRVSAGGEVMSANNEIGTTMPSVTFVHTPGAGSKTYTVRAINITTSTNTLFVNRTQSDSNQAFRSRGASSLVIQEVAV